MKNVVLEIRSAYAEAKEKVAKNGKNGQSPRVLYKVMSEE